MSNVLSLIFLRFSLFFAVRPTDSGALLSTSSDRMYDSQYLRVTLKSLLPINRFLIKAVNKTHQDMKGK